MSSNAGAFAALDAQIKAVRTLPDLPEAVAPDVARELEKILDQQIARGESPDGTPLKKTAEGATPLTGAAKALSVTAVGASVFATLRGPEARHHLGLVRGGIKRQILPTKSLPAPAVEAIKRVLAQKFRAALG